jgi:hypothetical protein
MQHEAHILMADINQKYQELVPLLEKLKEYVAHNATNAVELADIAFSCRQTETATTEFLKRVRELMRVSSGACCLVISFNGENIVRTDHCTATPNPKPWYKIPYKREQNSDKWDAIMEAIGVSDLANRKDLVRLHAPSFMDYCGELIGEGQQPPDGVDPKKLVSVELNLRITKRK